jgi:hypothetical protein
MPPRDGWIGAQGVGQFPMTQTQYDKIMSDAAEKECRDRLAELGEAKVRLMYENHMFPTAWHAHVIEWLSEQEATKSTR